MEIKKFQKLIWDFYRKNKRNFPWRETKDPYKILISEIMLQQTQADRVVVYYKRFLKKFPNFTTLAKAKFQDIYPSWQGLGYNRRAMALKKLAEVVVEKYHAKLPSDPKVLVTLPGIGPYTANAVAIFAWNMPLTCLETNIRRVFTHCFLADKVAVSDTEILALANAALDAQHPREWHWALMDYGAYLKKTIINPNRKHTNYRVQAKFEGSLRQIRGGALKLLAKECMGAKDIAKSLSREVSEVRDVLTTLTKEGFLEYNKATKLFSLHS